MIDIIPEPIAFKVTRFRCPTCPRSASSRARVREHMDRCWNNPGARGCKTCRFFSVDVDHAESCDAGIDLSGHPACPRCQGFGTVAPGDSCPDCDNSPKVRDEQKPGPLIHCYAWEPAEVAS